MLAKAFIDTGVIVVFLVGGLLLGSNLRRTYDRLFPGPDYVVGNYEELYKRTEKPIVIFSTSTCRYCQYARELLRRENVAYHDYIIDQSVEARRQFDALDGSGVPMLFIGNRRIVGFREKVIRDSLARIGKHETALHHQFAANGDAAAGPNGARLVRLAAARK